WKAVPRLAHVNHLRKPPCADWFFNLDDQFWKCCEIRDHRRSELSCFRESLVDRSNVVLRRKFFLRRVDRANPVGERFWRRNFAAQTSVIEMAMRVDQARNECLLTEIDDFAGMVSIDFRKCSYIRDPISL